MTRPPAPRPRHVKMKDLERATGVSRETIRYYIREGLLPEPERPERNVAWYDASFVERILLIKRLQSERFLPLSVIKGIVGDPRELTAAEARALHALDGQIAPAAERAAVGPHPPETLARLAKRLGLTVKEIRELADAGAVEIVVREGKPSLEGTSVAIVESWARFRQAGFTDELGFTPGEAALYVETLTGLAREELRRFGARIPAKVDADTARRLAREGIDRGNELIGLLREAILLRLLAAGSQPGDRADTGDAG